MCVCMHTFTSYLSKLVVGAVILLDVVLSEPFDGFTVVHSLERPLGWFEVLEETLKQKKVSTIKFLSRENINSIC